MLSGRGRGRRGTVAMEAAILLPIIASLFVGVFDIISALTAWRQTRAASNAIAQAATNLAVQSSVPVGYDSLNVLASTDGYNASTAIATYRPDLLTAANSLYAVTLTSVAFLPIATCTAGGKCVCVTATTSGSTTTLTTALTGSTTAATASPSTTCFTANVAWSVAMGQGSPVRGGTTTRACGVLTPVAIGTSPSLTTLPQGLYGPWALLIADVTYTYRPTFLTYITGNLAFTETSYVQPRVGGGSTAAIGTMMPYIDYSPYTSSALCVNPASSPSGGKFL